MSARILRLICWLAVLTGGGVAVYPTVSNLLLRQWTDYSWAQAQQSLQAGDQPQARATLKSLLNLHPWHLPARAALARLEHDRGEYGLAMALRDSLADLAPGHALLTESWSLDQLEPGTRAGNLELEAALRLAETDSAQSLILALTAALAQCAEPRSVAQLIRQLYGLDGGAAQMRELVARLSARRQDPAGGAARIPGIGPVEILGQALYGRPAALIQTAQLHIVQNNAVAFQSALNIAEDQFAETGLADGLRSLALQAAEQPELAAQALAEGLRRAPRSRPLLVALHNMLGRQSGAAAAAERMEALLARDPDFDRARELAVKSLVASGRLGRAEQLLQDDLSRRPDAEKAAVRLATFYLELGRVPEAAAVLEKARLRMGPAPQLVRLLAHAQNLLNQPDAAIASLESLRDHPEFSAADANNLAMLRLAHDPAQLDAKQWTALAARIAPQATGSPELLDTLGLIDLHLDRPEAALAHLRQAVSLSGAPALRVHLARALVELKQDAAARAALEQALADGREFAERMDAQILLQTLGQ